MDHATQADLADVLVTDELARRVPSPPDHRAETDAYLTLARTMAGRPADLPRALARAAVRLCRAGTAGVSLLEPGPDGDERFRWVALAGGYEGREGGTTPGDFSPCGTCLDRGAPQLFSRPARRFTYLDRIAPPIVEALVIPFGVGRPTLGTIWVVTHDGSRAFDREDVRVMTGLADFAAAALRLATAAEANAALCRTLRDADRRKDAFLATLAHELRNPLAPVRNAAQVLRLKGPPSPELEWARGVIDRQVQQMTHLIDDLLDVSRIALDKLALHRERVLLGTVVRGAVETSRPLIDRHGHELIVTLPPDPIALEADPTRLAQVFSNLLTNAAKYSGRGGRIRLTAEREGGDAVVTVRDTGVGISAEMLPHVFEMYAQVESQRERSEGGLGIGLALVKQLVTLHGGSVEARSDGPGRGSEFVVRLPVDLAARARHGRRGDDPATGSPSGLRVLVVDDDRDAADSLGMLLRLTGNDPRTAYDGDEALGVAGEFRPDVILLGIGLPGVNGYGVARRVRGEPWGRRVALIAVTGRGREEDRRRAREAGFDDLMVKPVEPSTLTALLAGLQRAPV